MNNIDKNEIIKGITCETCSEERRFGYPPNNDPDNKYIYIDLGGNTRCFCKEHMTYGNGKGALLHYNDKWTHVNYGAKLISKIIEQENDPTKI